MTDAKMAKALASLNKRRKSSLSFLAKPKLLHFGRRGSLHRDNSKKSKVKPQKPPKMGKTSRVVVCGMAGVGKTAILEQLIYGNITPSTELYPTIEDIYVASVETERGTREKMRLYDTAGLPPLSGPNAGGSSQQQQQQQQQLAKQLLGLTEGYVLVYDPARPESFECLLPLKRDIDKNRDKKEVAVVVLANRMRPTANVSGSGNSVPAPANLTASATLQKANNWTLREHMKHFEVNAMERASLLEPFVYLATKLSPPPNKSTFPQLSMVRKSISNRPDAAS